MKATLRAGSSSGSKLPELIELSIAQELWQRFGTRAWPADVQDWTDQQYDDAITIIAAEQQVAREKQQPGVGGSAPVPVDTTQAAYEQMARNAVSREEAYGLSP